MPIISWIKVPIYLCSRCGHKWTPLTSIKDLQKVDHKTVKIRIDKPKWCPKCHNPNWDK